MTHISKKINNGHKTQLKAVDTVIFKSKVKYSSVKLTYSNSDQYYHCIISLLNRLKIAPKDLSLVGLIAFGKQTNNYQALSDWLHKNISNGCIDLPQTLDEFECVYWRLLSDIEGFYWSGAASDY